MIRFLLTLLFLTTLALSAPPKDLEWKKGSVAKVWHTHVSEKTAKKKTRFIYTTHYRVEAEGATFDGNRGGRYKHDLGPIEYAVNDKHLYLKEADGKTVTLDREEN